MGEEAKLFLRTVTALGAGVLRFSNTPIMCSRVFDDIHAVFERNRMIKDSSRA